MSTKPEETKETSGNFFSSLATLFSPLLLLVLLFLATLIGGLGVVLVGRIVSQVFGLSLFEASLIALGTGLGVIYVFAQILRPQHTLEAIEPDWDEDEEDFEEEEDFVDVPPPKSSFSEQLPRAEPAPGRNEPCWCGSGKKYKNCHGR
jgi:hypothetical protein